MSKSDVVVIGSGFAGLIAALVSAEKNKKVTLIKCREMLEIKFCNC